MLGHSVIPRIITSTSITLLSTFNLLLNAVPLKCDKISTYIGLVFITARNPTGRNSALSCIKLLQPAGQ